MEFSQFSWGDYLLNCNRGLHKICLRVIAIIYLTVRNTFQAEVQAGYSDLLLFFGRNNTYRLKGTLGITG